MSILQQTCYWICSQYFLMELTMRALRFHSIRTALTACWTQRTTILVHTRWAPTARLWRPYVNPTLLERRGNAEPRRLFWACSKCAPLFGVLCIPMASTGDATALLRRYLRSHNAHIGVLHFSWRPWDRRGNAAPVWQGFYDDLLFTNVLLAECKEHTHVLAD